MFPVLGAFKVNSINIVLLLVLQLSRWVLIPFLRVPWMLWLPSKIARLIPCFLITRCPQALCFQVFNVLFAMGARIMQWMPDLLCLMQHSVNFFPIAVHMKKFVYSAKLQSIQI